MPTPTHIAHVGVTHANTVAHATVNVHVRADRAQAFARSRASSASRDGQRLFSAEGALLATLWEPEHRGQEVMIFGGIIDVLQQYGACE